MEDLISVIVPIYNKEKYLKACLDSILQQNYKNLEIILINDGSTDASGQICQQYKDSRIKYIATPNRGAACARNEGNNIAKGKYISFIDADDYIAANYYQDLHELLNKYNAQIAVGGYTRVDENSLYKFVSTEPTVEKMNNIESLIELYGKEDEEHVKMVIMCNKLFCRKLFSEIRYIPGRVIDDETIIYKLLNKANSVVQTDQILYAYVQSQNSVMRKDFSMKRLDDSILVYDEAIDYFKENQDILACVLKRAIFFYTQFISNVMDSNMKEKRIALQKIEKNYEEKRRVLESLLDKTNVNINYEKIIGDYQKQLQKYF